MFEKLIETVLADAEARKEKNVEIFNAMDDRRLRDYSTATRWEQYTSGKITRDECVAFALKRENKKVDRNVAKDIELIHSIENAGDVNYINISIEWNRSSVWGYNPTAECFVGTDKTGFRCVGHASGCGYDKESASVASALNQSLAIRKMLMITLLRDGKLPYGTHTWNGITRLDGGVGMSSFRSVFEACGLKQIASNHGKRFDAYTFEK